MASSFFFYDLETSGFNPRSARIMQFAGQRTDMDLKPVGEPVNELIKMTEDILPEPDAILVTGITPQQTVADGMTEAEFIKLFNDQIAKPGTIFVGYNTVRFDDEFMRFLHYRNFYDPYEWQWKDGRGRWDLLDVVRMTRALRPGGIKWPVDDKGKATNRLELLTKFNELDHSNAHDALSDVLATIEVAKLIKSKQPKLFDYLLSVRDKREVAELVNSGKPFVYTSGKYPSEFEKTTIAVRLVENDRQGALVYDLRHDPAEFSKLSAEELVERWQYTREENAPPRLPIKSLQFNRCPAVAPLNVLDQISQKRIKIDMDIIKQNLKKLQSIKNWPADVLEALEIMDNVRKERQPTTTDVDSQLYDGFFDNNDRRNLVKVNRAGANELQSLEIKFDDKRLNKLMLLYKARNFKQTLSAEDRQLWDKYRYNKLIGNGENSQLAKFSRRLAELSSQNLPTDKKFLLEELQLWAESIMPDPDVGDELQ